jgi:hypothetical protein
LIILINNGGAMRSPIDAPAAEHFVSSGDGQALRPTS